jgi:hypothetical protein
MDGIFRTPPSTLGAMVFALSTDGMWCVTSAHISPLFGTARDEAVMTLREWFRSFTAEKSVLAYKALSEAPMNDPGLWKDRQVGKVGMSRLATVTRPGYDVPDAAKLRLLKHKADVVRMADRRVSK